MKCIPPVCTNPDASKAEQRLLALLRDTELGAGWSAFHSVGLDSHAYKHWAEADFVLVGPGGVLVLEVKGGGVVRDEDGRWTSTDRTGIEHPLQDPFEQSKSAAYALARKLNAELSELRSGLQVGWGVVFPDVQFNVRDVSIPLQMVADQHNSDSPAALSRYLARLVDYWEGQGSRSRQLSESSVVAIAKYLRPSFDLVPSLRAALEDIERKLCSLTEEQYEVLDGLEGNPRVLVQGGAGTGKTFLALELGRRLHAAGRKPMLVTFSALLARYLQEELQAPFPIQSWAELTQPVSPARADEVNVLLVDEGQDLMHFEALERLEQLLPGGWEKGHWWWFLDTKNQAGVTGEFDAEALAYLRSLGPASYQLRRNVRNTPQIVQESMFCTGADIGVTQALGGGPEVAFIDVDSAVHTAARLAIELERWRQEGILPGEIAVLSGARAIEESCVQHLPAKWKHKVHELSLTRWSFQHRDRLLWSRIAEFKGLERRVIAIVDLPADLAAEELRKLLYVGMTRAQGVLWLGLELPVRQAIKALRTTYIPAVLAKAGMQA